MAFIRNCFVITIAMFAVFFTNAQTISYPVQSSKTLKSTAEDVALLLQKQLTAVILPAVLIRHCHNRA